MGRITLSEQDLHARPNQLHAVFSPLRGQRERVALRFANDGPGGAKALVATDQKTGRLRYREEMFRTSVNTLRCKYFELWTVANGRELCLERAYFTLLRVAQSTRTFDEVLCLHTDPTDADEFKQGPHLHVKCAEDPISHCHFPLDLGWLEMVLTDCSTLTQAMERAIGVVAKDVLPRF